jgi:hypothetical protein
MRAGMEREPAALHSLMGAHVTYVTYKSADVTFKFELRVAT